MKKLLKQIPIVSVLISGWQLASKGFANDSPKYRRKQQWKIVFHTLFNPIFASKWFKLLKSPEFNYVYLHRTQLYIKPFRVYISSKWNKKQKVKEKLLSKYLRIKMVLSLLTYPLMIPILGY